jgi:bacteriorhodopsin
MVPHPIANAPTPPIQFFFGVFAFMVAFVLLPTILVGTKKQREKWFPAFAINALVCVYEFALASGWRP